MLLHVQHGKSAHSIESEQHKNLWTRTIYSKRWIFFSYWTLEKDSFPFCSFCTHMATSFRIAPRTHRTNEVLIKTSLYVQFGSYKWSFYMRLSILRFHVVVIHNEFFVDMRWSKKRPFYYEALTVSIILRKNIYLKIHKFSTLFPHPHVCVRHTHADLYTSWAYQTGLVQLFLSHIFFI